MVTIVFLLLLTCTALQADPRLPSLDDQGIRMLLRSLVAIAVLLAFASDGFGLADVPPPVPDRQELKPDAQGEQAPNAAARAIAPQQAPPAPKPSPGGRVLRGVVQSTDGDPLPGVRVVTGNLEPVRTDDSGRFTFEVPGEISKLTIRTSVTGFRDAKVVVPLEGGREIDLSEPIRLSPKPGLVGRVLDADGRPVADARVRCVDQNAETDTDREPVRTDSAGWFHIEGKFEDTVALEITHREFLDRIVLPVECGKGTSTRVPDVRLMRGQVIRGRLTDADGAPISGVKVVAVESGGSNWINMTCFDSEDVVVSDRDGRYRIAGLFLRTYIVLGHGAGWVVPIRPDVAVRKGRETVVDLVLTRGKSIAGVVRDSDGAPLPGATVRVMYPDDGSFRADVGRVTSRYPVTTDGTGRFHLRGLGEGPVGVHVVMKGFVPGMKRNVAPGRDDLEFSLTRASRVRGRVVSAETGEPVEGATVDAHYAGPGSVTTASDGTFDLVVAPGSRTVRVWCEGYLWRETQVENLKPGEVREGVEIALKPGHRLRGRVVHARDGTPLAGAWVRIEGPQGRSIRTDAEGRFAVRGLPPGTYEIEVSAHRFPEKTVTGLVLPQEEEITILLEPGATISGLVLDAEGKPAALRYVVLADTDERWMGETATDRKGEFTFTGLPTGEYVVLVFATSRRGRHGSATGRVRAEVTVRPGEDARVEVREKKSEASATVGGRVMCRGQPVEATGTSLALVRLDLPAGSGLVGGIHSAPIDQEGAWSISGLPLGRYAALIVRNENSHMTPAGEIHVVRTGEQTADLQLPTGRLEGRIVDEEGKPIGDASVSLRDAELARLPLAESPRYFQMIKGMGRTEEDGTYVIEHVPPGTWFVVALDEGYAPTVRSSVAIPSEGVAKLDLALGRGHAVQLQLKDSAGEAIAPRAGIGLRDGEGRLVVGPEWRHVVNTTGPTELRLGAGRWRVFVQAEKFAPGEVGVDVDEDEDTTAELVLRRGGRLKLTVTGGVKGAVVSLYHSDGGEVARPFSFDRLAYGTMSSRTDKNGTLTIENVPAGEITVRVATRDGRKGTAKVEIADGRSAEVAVELK